MNPSTDVWQHLGAPPPVSVLVRGTRWTVGQRVRLRPRERGDVMDLALGGRLAVVESIDVTTDGEPHFSVTLDADPARDLGARGYPGHRFFFRADELELVDSTIGSPASRVLVAGIGNIFFGDDAFGVAVVQRLVQELVFPGVTVADFGIRGLDLAYALQDAYDTAILVDATTRGGLPGTVYVIEPALDSLGATETGGVALDAHGMDPVAVLRLARSLGRIPPRITIVGCEPASLESDASSSEALVTLSPPVAAAVPVAARIVRSVIRNLTTPITP